MLVGVIDELLEGALLGLREEEGTFDGTSDGTPFGIKDGLVDGINAGKELGW